MEILRPLSEMQKNPTGEQVIKTHLFTAKVKKKKHKTVKQLLKLKKDPALAKAVEAQERAACRAPESWRRVACSVNPESRP